MYVGGGGGGVYVRCVVCCMYILVCVMCVHCCMYVVCILYGAHRNTPTLYDFNNITSMFAYPLILRVQKTLNHPHKSRAGWIQV